MILSLLTGSTPSPHIPLLPPKDPPAIVKELTLEEKIQTNFYKCNTDLEWIRADNAQCLPKSPVAAEKPSQPIENTPGNAYEPGQCVWYVKNRKPDIPNSWGNASSWLYNAQAQGWPTGSEPRAGAVGWTSGHVVYIESVNGDGTVTYSDMNGRWIAFELGSGTVPATKYQYIY